MKNPEAQEAGSAARGHAVEPREAALRSATTVEVRRSARRRRTVSAYRDGDRTIVLLPARMSRADEQRWIDVMLERLAAQERRRGGRASRGDDELHERAEQLSRQYFGGRTNPSSVRWVANQNSRWGSCTPADGTIRLSDRLRVMPSWVIDYVLVHELAHLIEIGHGPRFQKLVESYPKAERARGYLLGVSAATGDPAAAEPDDEMPDDEMPDDEMPDDEMPDAGARHAATERDATLRDATRRDATLRDATRRDATLRDATRREGQLW